RCWLGSRSRDRMADHKLGKRGSIFTFTIDNLAPVPEHPLPMAVVDLEGGGRLYLQVTDAADGEGKVGAPVELTFRRLHEVGGNRYYLEGPSPGGAMKDRVAVIGIGCTKVGDRFERSYEELICAAAVDAYADAGIDPSEIEAAYLGTYLPGPGGGKAAVSLADALRLYDRPITRVENYCATGTDAFRNGCLAVAAGTYDLVLVLGAEKLKDRGGRGIPRLGHPLLARGNTAPGLFALAANRYIHTFGLRRETLAKVAVKNHRNGARNPKAHLRMEVTEEQVLKAPIIAWPFGLFDCCPTTDGAAAAII